MDYSLYYDGGRLSRLMGRAYGFLDLGGGGYLVRVAYPVELFEEGNMPGFLTSVAGNVFGMRRVRWLRVEDIYFPRRFLEHFKGPFRGFFQFYSRSTAILVLLLVLPSGSFQFYSRSTSKFAIILLLSSVLTFNSIVDRHPSSPESIGRVVDKLSIL